MNRCEFSFIISCSISFCDVTCIIHACSVNSTFLISANFHLLKVCDQRSHLLFSFLDGILCYYWVDSKYLYLLEIAECLRFRHDSLLLVIFCLTLSIVTLYNSTILSSLDNERISVKKFFSFCLCVKSSFQKYQIFLDLSVSEE